ncbi:hypothetical protein ACFE04_017704 [Oxalis oulophora]
MSDKPTLDLELNLSPPSSESSAENMYSSEEYSNYSSSWEISDSSCVSSETDDEKISNYIVTSPMVLVGCPRCLMYVMLSKLDSSCPKCKSTALLDFLKHA